MVYSIGALRSLGRERLGCRDCSDWIEVVAHHRQQLHSGRVDGFQIGNGALLSRLLSLSYQELGVADDVVEGRAEIVDQARGQRMIGCEIHSRFLCSHGFWSPTAAGSRAASLKSASILLRRRGSSMGFVS